MTNGIKTLTMKASINTNQTSNASMDGKASTIPRVSHSTPTTHLRKSQMATQKLEKNKRKDIRATEKVLICNITTRLASLKTKRGSLTNQIQQRLEPLLEKGNLCLKYDHKELFDKKPYFDCPPIFYCDDEGN